MFFLHASGISITGADAAGSAPPTSGSAVVWAWMRQRYAGRLRRKATRLTHRGSVRTIQGILLAGSILVLILSGGASAAPITGTNQANPPPESEQAPTVDPNQPEAIEETGAIVIEFSVVPTLQDPNIMETVIIVRRSGGSIICVNQISDEILTRSYRKRGDEPFEPVIPSELRGQTSGDTGELVGFNEFTLFIRPHAIDDEFTDADECFTAGDAEGCFIPVVEDCDQPMEEGDLVCVSNTISSAGCALLDHANLTRGLRILLALNQPPGEAPIITAADIREAAEVTEVVGEPEAEGGEPPAGGPVAEPPTGGSGGGELVTVPNVIGLPLQAAEIAITAVGLRVGTVQTASADSGILDNAIIRTAHAQACQPGNVKNQNPAPGTQVPPDTAVNLELCPEIPAIPEPATWLLFTVGLVLLVFVAGWRRKEW